MRTVGLGLFFEDYAVGDQFRTIGRTVTETDIVNFVNCTGMTELLFTNIEFAMKESAAPGRLAPGALVYCLAEGLLMQSVVQGAGLAFLHMDFDVRGPTFAGDTIHVECEVTEARPASKGARGLVRTRNEIRNQKGATVIVYTPLRLVKRRPEVAQ
ncbi:MAG: MaoC family dehydratase N-terminal domain-containing protein [Alphaproteobacteria bacterium]|nr:MaoC family dehydratase N-terminal domain-containing protein [Alphaproteobacteria bacterium]